MEPKFEPVQGNILRPSKGHEVTDSKRDADQAGFKKFHKALLEKLLLYQDDTILTLEYYLKNSIDQEQIAKVTLTCHDAGVLNNSCRIPWWLKMSSDYESFADAVKNKNLDRCRDLIGKGLNIHGKLRNETMTAIEYAVKNNFIGFIDLVK